MSLTIAISASRGRTATCAVRLDDREIASSDGQPRDGSALLATLDETLRSVNAHPRDVDEVRVDIGPGSYTGLRVAVTCARFLARFSSQDVPLVATATSFELIAAKLLAERQPDTILHCLLDARRDRVYHAALALRKSAAGDEKIEFLRRPAAHDLSSLDLDLDSSVATIFAADPSMATRFRAEIEGFGSCLGIPEYGAEDLFDERVGLRWERLDGLQPLYLMASYAVS